QVHHTAAVSPECVLGRTIGHEHDVILVAQPHALIEINGCAACSQSIRGGRGKARLNRKLNVGGQFVSRNRNRSRRDRNSRTPVLHLYGAGGDEGDDVTLALCNGLTAVSSDHRQRCVICRIYFVLFDKWHQRENGYTR